MSDVQQGQAWEMYSTAEGRWIPVIVVKLEDEDVILRYVGVLEFLTVKAEEMYNDPKRFRLTSDQTSC
jgi:hypothetical protein